jgi:predicted MFS family arabinose efflux permease
LIEASTWGWGSSKTIAGFAVAAVLIAAFVIIERRHKTPLVPLRIFSDRSLAAADATFLLVAAGLFGMFFFTTLYLQQVLGYTALNTGVAYLPLTLTLIGASALASRLVDRFTPRPILITGLLIAAGGFLFLIQLSGRGDYTSHVLPAMIILGIGLGISFVPATIAATSGVAAEDSGLAAGLLNATQEVGGSLGLAILSTVATTRITNALHGGAPVPVALTHGFTGAFTVSGLLCAASAVLAVVLLPRRKRAVKNEQVETMAIALARAPGAPNCGHLAGLAALGRRSAAAHR